MFLDGFANFLCLRSCMAPLGPLDPPWALPGAGREGEDQKEAPSITSWRRPSAVLCRLFGLSDFSEILRVSWGLRWGKAAILSDKLKRHSSGTAIILLQESSDIICDSFIVLSNAKGSRVVCITKHQGKETCTCLTVAGVFLGDPLTACIVF